MKINILKNKYFILLIKTLTIFVFGAHFIILFTFQMPDNPIKHQYKHELYNYMHPFFSQVWTLFAPNPINTNRSLLYRFSYQTIDKKQDTTIWIDATEPLIVMRENNFWSPIQRVSKFTQSSMSSVNESHLNLLNFIKENDSLKDNTEKAKKVYDDLILKSEGYKSVLIYSKYIANNFFKDNKLDVDKGNISVQFKIFDAKFPRFSKRKDDYYDLSKYEFNELKSDFIIIKTDE